MNLALILLKTEPAHPLFDAVRISWFKKVYKHMKTTLQQLKKWIRLVESEHLEFKLAGRQFDFELITWLVIKSGGTDG